MINLTIAIAKNKPTKPKTPIDKYQTPKRMIGGHSGNITPANIQTTIAKPPSLRAI